MIALHLEGPRPWQVLFLEAGRRGIQKEGPNLDDQIREGNIDFAKKVFARFLQRQDERYKTSPRGNARAEAMTSSIDEYLSDDPDKIDLSLRSDGSQRAFMH